MLTYRVRACVTYVVVYDLGHGVEALEGLLGAQAVGREQAVTLGRVDALHELVGVGLQVDLP